MNEHYWILFKKSKTLWEIFFYGKFSHVSLLKNDGYNWLFIDPRPSNLHVSVLPHLPEEGIHKVLKYFDEDCSAIKVCCLRSSQAKFKIRKVLRPRFFNCVRAIRYILGLRLKGFFPDGFYNYLDKSHKENKTDELIVDSFFIYRSKK